MKKLIIAALIIISVSILSLPVFAADNLMLTASLYECTGYINGDEQAAFLFDGDYNTKWCATPDNADYSSSDFSARHKEGYAHILAVDFGRERYFDSYRLYLASSGERDYGLINYDAEAWTIQISADGMSWEDVSRVEYCSENVVTVNLGIRAARYLRILVDRPEQGGGSTVRLYELEVFACEKGETAAGLITTEGSNVGIQSDETVEVKEPIKPSDSADSNAGEGDDIAYAPSEAVEYEGYKLGIDGVIALCILFAAAEAAAIFAAKNALKNKIYDM